MDDIVLRGMAKWPNVPAVYGWLALDRRGQWLIKGERISNTTVTEFIGRNYERDDRGCWFFQNGPQRVFVELDYTPFVLRVTSAERAPLELATQTGKTVGSFVGAWLDEDGSLLLAMPEGPAVVDDRDLDRLTACFVDANGTPLEEPVLEGVLDALAEKRPAAPLWFKLRENNVKVEPIAARDAPQKFGFVREPQPPDGAERSEEVKK